MIKARRVFCKTALAAGLATFSKFSLAGNLGRSLTTSSEYQIDLIEGRYYPPSFIQYAKNARFSSPEEAVESVFDRRLAFRLKVVAA